MFVIDLTLAAFIRMDSTYPGSTSIDQGGTAATYCEDTKHNSYGQAVFDLFEVMTGVQQHPISKELHYITCGRWIVFLRKDFDCFLNEEPQQAISLFLHLETGKFLLKVWARTVRAGFLQDLATLNGKLEETFQNTLPCTGIVVLNENDLYENSLSSDVPFLRTYSKSCQYISSKSQNTSIKEANLCGPCNVMKNLGDINMEEWEDEDDHADEAEHEKEENELALNRELTPETTIKNEPCEEDSGEDEDWLPSWVVKTEMQNVNEDEDSSHKERATTKNRKMPKDRSKVVDSEERLICDLCPEKFEKQFQLSSHKKVVHLYAKYNCIGCDNVYKDGTGYLDHIMHDHPSIETVPCSTCNEKVDVVKWVSHSTECVRLKKVTRLREDNGLPGYKCKYCPQRFTDRPAKNGHQKKEHKEKMGFNCFFCEEKFKIHIHRKLHMEKIHEFGRFKCSVCLIKHKHIPQFFEHIKKSHSEISTAPCDVCSTEVLMDEYVSHRMKCIANREFEKRKKFNDKVKARGGVQCRHCDSKFATHAQRIEHENDLHTGNKYSCPDCDYETPSMLKFYYHKKRIHNAESNTVFCDICGKQLKKSTLKAHMEYVHEGKKDNVQCSDCGEVFERQTHLLKHRNLLHSTDPKFDCEICGRRFNGMASKSKHMQSHSEGTFPCEVCGRLLKSKKTLIAHMRVHTGEKPFK